MLSFLFFFNDTATTEIYTLSLHDALPISFCRSHDREGRTVNEYGWEHSPRSGVPPRLHDAWPCFSCSPSAGSLRPAFWTSGVKSSNSCTWRTSIISLSEAGQRLAHSTASSFDFT